MVLAHVIKDFLSQAKDLSGQLRWADKRSLSDLDLEMLERQLNLLRDEVINVREVRSNDQALMRLESKQAKTHLTLLR